MSIINNFKFPDNIDFKSFLTNEDVIITALDIASTAKDDSRSDALKLENAMNGVALEFAVIDFLIAAGHDIRPALKDDGTKDYALDFFLVLNEQWHKFDVKGMFASNASTFGQTRWEHNHASPSTIYLCFDCRTGEAKFSGWCTHAAFNDSIKNGNKYIYPNRLKK